MTRPTCCNAPMRRMVWSIFADLPALRCEVCGRMEPDLDYEPDETDEDSRWSLGARRSTIERGY